MNEQIRELAEQAAQDTRILHNNAYWRMQDELAEDTTWREKFAELIVGQCLSVLETKIDEGEGYGSFESGQHIGLIRARNIIKKHFGVE